MYKTISYILKHLLVFKVKNPKNRATEKSLRKGGKGEASASISHESSLQTAGTNWNSLHYGPVIQDQHYREINEDCALATTGKFQDL